VVKQAAPRQATLGPYPQVQMAGAPYVIIALLSGIATGFIGRSKGSSFFIWSLVGLVLPIIGLVAVILYRGEREEPERQCPNCSKILKLHVQVCPRCGTELYLPDPSEVRPGPADRPA
jgi:hypothetical protein